MMKKILLTISLFGISNVGYADFRPLEAIDLKTGEIKTDYTTQPMGCDTIFPGFSYIYSSKCPKEKPFMEISFKKDCWSIISKKETGKCEGCDYLGAIEIFSGHDKDFDICQNRIIKEFRQISYSIIKECPLDAFRSDNSNCILCNNKYPIWTSKKECLKCPNREYIDGNCVLKKETK